MCGFTEQSYFKEIVSRKIWWSIILVITNGLSSPEKKMIPSVNPLCRNKIDLSWPIFGIRDRPNVVVTRYSSEGNEWRKF